MKSSVHKSGYCETELITEWIVKQNILALLM